MTEVARKTIRTGPWACPFGSPPHAQAFAPRPLAPCHAIWEAGLPGQQVEAKGLLDSTSPDLPGGPRSQACPQRLTSSWKKDQGGVAAAGLGRKLAYAQLCEKNFLNPKGPFTPGPEGDCFKNR